MYILNGIVHAGEPRAMLKVIGVQAVGDHILRAEFSTGEYKRVDLSELLESPAFSPLKDRSLFAGVYLDHGVPTWNDGEIDISPEYLYEMGVAENIGA